MSLNTVTRWAMTQVSGPLSEVKTEGTLSPGAGEVVVKISGCGVCHTDLGFLSGGVRTNKPLPLTLGHEISGVVQTCGAGAEKWQGKSVIVPAVIPCGECMACKRNRPNICTAQKMPGNDIDGGFASHIVVPARGLCEVPASSTVDLASLSVVADAVTTPYQAIVRAGLQKGDFAIFVGAGGVGGFGVQIAKAFGATVVALDVNDARLEMMKSLGADAVFNVKSLDPKELKTQVKAACKAANACPIEWKIFETSGTGAGQETAYNLLNHGATLSVVGFTMDKLNLRLSNLMAFDARAIGNWGCPPELYPPALALVLSGQVKVEPLIERFPLAQINEVMVAAHEHKLTRRPVLIP